jgi:RimJ/RimL family protein N-acetyltransferase
MIFAQTERLTLRSLEKSELPRLVELLDVWDIVRWLSVVPFPYTRRHAEAFYAELEPLYAADDRQFFAMSLKSDNLLIGGVGLHPPRGDAPTEGVSEIGYWLGKDFWGQGLMSEAARAVIDIGFGRPETRAIGASTATNNKASQNVLRKIGLRDCGIVPRDYAALRGDDQIIKWLLTRQEYEQGKTL